jgi:hypothetical protein
MGIEGGSSSEYDGRLPVADRQVCQKLGYGETSNHGTLFPYPKSE